MSVWQGSLDLLNDKAKTHGSILVAYSGGKDSLAVLDLACRTFKKVVCFYMYWAPGLELVEKQIRFAKERYGVTVLQYPHFSALQCLRQGVFCDTNKNTDRIPDVRLKDLYRLVMEETGIKLLATGAKDADGLNRRQFFANIRDSNDELWDGVIYPIKKWKKGHVLQYLKTQNIPIPVSAKGVSSGVSIGYTQIHWIYENHPEDFKKLERVFPYLRAQVYRKQWYNI